MPQERKKRRIVLASILKPVDDTRMLEKIGVSLAQSGLYEVIIIGYPSPHKPSVEGPDFHLRQGSGGQVVGAGIQVIPLDPFPRLSIKRLLAKWLVYQITWRLNPDIFLFSTHELIFPAVFLKLNHGVKIIYDVRENYYRNILLSGSFPKLLRIPLALLVRAKEKIFSSFIDHFFLAEKGYENEFGFHKRSWTVIENKAVSPPDERTVSVLSRETLTCLPRRVGAERQAKAGIRLLFSGTLSDSTGVFEAIRLAEALHQKDPSVELVIAGRAAISGVLVRIRLDIKARPYIRLIGGDVLVPHNQILQLISESDAGILAYPPSEHTANSRPTKMYEYLSGRLPIILQKHWPWIPEYESIQPFIYTDFSKPDPTAILNQLKASRFYVADPANIDWNSEAPKLLKTLENL